MAFKFFFSLAILFHLFCDTKLGEWFGSRDHEREAFTCFFSPSFLLSTVHLVLTISYYMSPCLSLDSCFAVLLRTRGRKSQGAAGRICFLRLDLGGFVLYEPFNEKRRRFWVLAIRLYILPFVFLLFVGRVCELYIIWLYPHQYFPTFAM